MTNQLFPLGRIVITANAHARLREEVVLASLDRHAQGDWGNVCEDDRLENELSLERGFRLLSVYKDQSEPFWIITENDRSVTTILMPGDY
jgi:hypothetical protein